MDQLDRLYAYAKIKMSVNKQLLTILILFGLGSQFSVTAENIVTEEVLSAGELLSNCEEEYLPGAPNQYCMRYVFGLVQTVISLQQAEQSLPLFCINPQVTRLEEATDNVIGYLRSQSYRSNEDAYIIATEALNKNYPCSPDSQILK